MTDYIKTSSDILNFYNTHITKIFAFSNTNILNEVYLTYNVSNIKQYNLKFKNTILIHRKKQTNTLYSLNGMNRLIEEECGVKDANYKLDWNLYKDSLIITGDVSIRIIPLKLMKILPEKDFSISNI
jgi:hypothetical protein